MEYELEKKICLVTGKGSWHTHEVDNLPSIHISDGPHGLRKQNEKESHNNNSFVATCFPTSSASACSFDTKLIAVRSFSVKLAGAMNQGICALILIICGIYGISQKYPI